MKTPREAAIEYWNRANDTKLETAIAARDAEWKAKVSAGTVSLAELEKELAAARAENAKLRARPDEAEQILRAAPLKMDPLEYFERWHKRANAHLLGAPAADSPVPADRRCPRCEAPMSMFSSASTCDRCAGLWTEAYQAGREFERTYGSKSADSPPAGEPVREAVIMCCKCLGPHSASAGCVPGVHAAPDPLAPVWAKLRDVGLRIDDGASIVDALAAKVTALGEWARMREKRPFLERWAAQPAPVAEPVISPAHVHSATADKCPGCIFEKKKYSTQFEHALGAAKPETAGPGHAKDVRE